MNSCILTVIKNEQEYLDEWIKYHLDLGVSHIFIFEDIDSDSHKEICDKYGDAVSLNSIDIVLDEDSRNKALELKLTKHRSPQTIYFLCGLIWVKNNYQYNWCFVIDNDEFITFEKESSKLEDILSLYKDYDAFEIQWQCYGANGHIKKPDYKGKGLIETYTKKSDSYGNIVLQLELKTCYNMKTFKPSYFLNAHQHSSDCNWCKTDFSKSSKIIYDTVYLRHYITKSWEEYIAKRKRGYFMGFARTVDMFFRINQDMFPLKKQLLNDLKEETLVVMPYKQNGSQGDEIRITLNGWKKFCQFKYHFIVIGEFDESLKKEFPWVEFIYCPSVPKKEGQYNPHLDIQNKFNVVAKMYSQIYDGFIWICDDYYPIKSFDLSNITKMYYHSLNFIGNEKSPKSFWNYDKWKTRQLLDKEGLPHINYTIHYPCYFEFKKLDEIWKKYNMLEESYVLEDVYFNYFSHEEPILDSEIRLGIWNKTIFENEFQKAVDNPNIKFMCNSVEGWSKELEDELYNIVA